MRWLPIVILLPMFAGDAAALQPQPAPGPPEPLALAVSHRRAQPGDQVVVNLEGVEAVRAILLVPGEGGRDLPLVAGGGGRAATVDLPPNAPEGLYLVHAWRGAQERPAAVGKAAFLVGRMVVDFFLPAYVDAGDPAADIGEYLADFRNLGGNTLIAHALITPDKAFFPSQIARTDLRRGAPGDYVGHLLAEAERRGLAVFLSVSWDMTKRTPYRERMAEITSIMDELLALYAHHTSLIGFYSYQEGSGTYYVPYVREFTAHVKRFNTGLLTAVAPFLDDPLLAGYLSTVETLDVVIYQGMVMASYRTDNRQLFPTRRVRDFAALGIGAKWLQDKFAVVHVELFAYREKRQAADVIAASYEDIYRQILSVATAAASDGISLFAYHPHIHSRRAHPLVQRSRQAVHDAMQVFRRVTREVGPEPQGLAVYVPYSDWIVDRWTQQIVPALDGFRRAGVPVDILPYAPALEESHYPYFPIHLNPDVLARLLRTRQVLLLPDISGFQQTDSDLIDAFLAGGGTVVAFGPRIPMGRSYERDEVFGGRETGSATRRAIRVTDPFGRRVPRTERPLTNPGPWPAWEAGAARVLATFEDGSPAALANSSGKGLAVAVLPSVAQLATDFPDLLRDVLDLALAHAGAPPLPDVVGVSEETDLAYGRSADGFTLAIVNHAAEPQVVEVVPPVSGGSWSDVRTGGPIEGTERVRLSVPANDIRILRYRTAATGAGQ